MQRGFPDLVTLLRARAAQAAPPVTTYLDHSQHETEREERITAAQLDVQARAIAAELQSFTQPGERALLLYAPGLETAAAFFGALYAGLIPVPVQPPRPGTPPTDLMAFAADAEPAVLLTSVAIAGKFPPGLTWPDGTPIRLLATDGVSAASATSWQPLTPKPGDVAALLYTSGSTSKPKGVILTHEVFCAACDSYLQAFEQLRVPEEQPLVSWAPLFHVMGLRGAIISPLYCDAPAVLLSPAAFIERPVRWLRAISTHRGVVSSAPNFAFQMCVDKVTTEERAGLDLRSWRLAFLAAENIRMETIEAFARAYEPFGFQRRAFFTAYALSEASGTIDVNTSETKPVTVTLSRSALHEGKLRHVAASDAEAQTFVSCGAPVSGQELVVVDPDTRASVGADAVGEVWIRGPMTSPGYWRQPEETARTFGGERADDGEGGYLRTGDLGFLHEGELYVCGRIKDVVIIRGKKHAAVDLEQTAERAHPALAQGGAAAFAVDEDGEERLILVMELASEGADVDAVIAAVRSEVAQKHLVAAHVVVLVEAGSLPRTSTGKLQRQRCRDEYLRQSA